MGWISDRVGRVRMMVFGSLLIFATIIPFFEVLNLGGNQHTLAGMTGMWVVLSFYTTGLCCLMCEIFPTRIRFSGASLGYNIGMTVGAESLYHVQKMRLSCRCLEELRLLYLLRYMCRMGRFYRWESSSWFAPLLP